MLMSRLSSLAHKRLMLMFMLMLASLVKTGLNIGHSCYDQLTPVKTSYLLTSIT